LHIAADRTASPLSGEKCVTTRSVVTIKINALKRSPRRCAPHDDNFSHRADKRRILSAAFCRAIPAL